MNTISKKIFILIGLFLSSSVYSKNLSLEVDPATYVFNGYSMHLKTAYQNTEFGLGLYSMKIPSVLLSSFLSPSHNSFDLKIKNGQGLFVDRFIHSERNDGLFVGLQFGHQKYSLSDASRLNSSISYEAYLFMPRFGYKYRTTLSGFYLLPWAGLGYLHTNNSYIKTNNENVEPKKIVSFVTLHLGYEF